VRYSRCVHPIRVISLARDTRRRDEFLRRNAHVPSVFFDAVDGGALSLQDIRSTGLFTPQVEATYDAHSYGCALSHWHLWKEAAASAGPLTIAEDDALFRRDFEARSAGVMASLPSDWDIVLWGWNFDSLLCVHLMESASPIVMVFDQPRLRESLDAFQAQATPVQAFKLEKAFGLPAYTLSPQGAAKLLQLCFPQRPLSVWVPLFNRHLSNVGVDVAANAVYPQVQAFACFPPLAASPNVRGSAQPGSASTI
jgi:glycosyl transferase family 25